MSRWKIMNAASLFTVGVITAFWLPPKLYPTLAATPPFFRVEAMDFSNIPGVTVLPQNEHSLFVFPNGRKNTIKMPQTLIPRPSIAQPIPTDIHAKTVLIPTYARAKIVPILH